MFGVQFHYISLGSWRISIPSLAPQLVPDPLNWSPMEPHSSDGQDILKSSSCQVDFSILLWVKTPCFLGSSQWSHHVTLQLPGLLKRFKKHPNPTTNEVMKYYMKYPIVQILIHRPWKTVPEVPSWHAEHHCCARHRAWSLQKSPGKVPDSGARKCVRGHGWVWLVNDET